MPPTYPLVFEPLLKSKVWGGRRLLDLGKRLGPDPIGESWEIADLPDSIPEGRNAVAEGPSAGRTLRELIADDREGLLGAGRLSGDGGFPLLVKYLDAAENLSVQVHPTAEYVQGHPGTHLKSEAWIVVAAEPDAILYKGFRERVGPDDLRRRIADGSIVDLLRSVPARPGDCHYLPSGTCHALGAGILVAEIQTPSDTTFRIHDWGRTGRSLHPEQAIECLDLDPFDDLGPLPDRPIKTNSFNATHLVTTEHFTIERVEAMETEEVELVSENLPVIWMILTGSATATGGGETVAAPRGTTVLAPAGLLGEGLLMMTAGTTALRVTLPSPIEGMIA